MKEERKYRIKEAAVIAGCAEATLRKAILRKEIGYFKGKRMVLIPESEVQRLIGKYHPPVSVREAGR